MENVQTKVKTYKLSIANEYNINHNIGNMDYIVTFSDEHGHTFDAPYDKTSNMLYVSKSPRETGDNREPHEYNEFIVKIAY